MDAALFAARGRLSALADDSLGNLWYLCDFVVMVWLMGLQVADGIILAIIALSMMMGVMRGFVREAFSVFSWLAGWLVARHYAPALEVVLQPYVHTPSLRLLMAYILLFLATWLVLSLLAYLLQSLLSQVGLRWSDRILGAIFGLVRGLLIMEILLMLLAPYASHDTWWQRSRMVAVLVRYEPATRDMGRRFEKAALPVL